MHELSKLMKLNELINSDLAKDTEASGVQTN